MEEDEEPGPRSLRSLTLSGAPRAVRSSPFLAPFASVLRTHLDGELTATTKSLSNGGHGSLDHDQSPCSAVTTQ